MRRSASCKPLAEGISSFQSPTLARAEEYAKKCLNGVSPRQAVTLVRHLKSDIVRVRRNRDPAQLEKMLAVIAAGTRHEKAARCAMESLPVKYFGFVADNSPLGAVRKDARKIADEAARNSRTFLNREPAISGMTVNFDCVYCPVKR